jgi:hypothetical protein
MFCTLVPDVRTQTINHITRLRATAIIVRLTKMAHPISRHLYFIGAPNSLLSRTAANEVDDFSLVVLVSPCPVVYIDVYL